MGGGGGQEEVAGRHGKTGSELGSQSRRPIQLRPLVNNLKWRPGASGGSRMLPSPHAVNSAKCKAIRGGACSDWGAWHYGRRGVQVSSLTGELPDFGDFALPMVLRLVPGG